MRPGTLPTLDLKLRRKIFPVMKTRLLEKLALFYKSPGLLASDHYKVRSQVPMEDFKEFIRFIEGAPITVSELTYGSFSRLAKEFGFDQLSEACTAFLESRARGCAPEANTAPVERESDSKAVKRRVTITVKKRSFTYEALSSIDEIHAFANDLIMAREHGIVVEGFGDSGDRLVETAVEAVYRNTVESFSENYPTNPFLGLTLWEIQKILYSSHINASIYCLNRLIEMAPTAVDKARLLLLSQCDANCYGSFVPLPTADWGVIGDAINLLKYDKNGKREEALKLLDTLRRAGLYGNRFGK
jgi:hypothetical protein